MRHIDHTGALGLAEGSDDPRLVDHVAGCARCRQLVDRYRAVLGALESAAAAGEPPAALLRWARAFARQAAESRCRPTVLEFLTQGMQPVAAVRGSSVPGAALLFGDDEHHLDLRILPGAGGRVRVHGQVVPLSGGPASGWQVAVIGPSGAVAKAVCDDRGEFWLDQLEGWEGCSVVVQGTGQRLMVPRLGPPES